MSFCEELNSLSSNWKQAFLELKQALETYTQTGLDDDALKFKEAKQKCESARKEYKSFTNRIIDFKGEKVIVTEAFYLKRYKRLGKIEFTVYPNGHVENFTYSGQTSENAINLLNKLKIFKQLNNLCLPNIQSAKGLTLPKTINGYLNLYSLTSAEDLNLPEIVNRELYLSSLEFAKGLTLPKTINSCLILRSLESAEDLNLPETVKGDIYLLRLNFKKKEELRKMYPKLRII